MDELTKEEKEWVKKSIEVTVDSYRIGGNREHITFSPKDFKEEDYKEEQIKEYVE